MNLKQATLIALIGTSLAFIMAIFQYISFFENYMHLGIQQTILPILSICLNHIPIIVFFAVLYNKQQDD